MRLFNDCPPLQETVNFVSQAIHTIMGATLGRGCAVWRANVLITRAI